MTPLRHTNDPTATTTRHDHRTLRPPDPCRVEIDATGIFRRNAHLAAPHASICAMVQVSPHAYAVPHAAPPVLRTRAVSSRRIPGCHRRYPVCSWAGRSGPPRLRWRSAASLPRPSLLLARCARIVVTPRPRGSVVLRLCSGPRSASGVVGPPRRSVGVVPNRKTRLPPRLPRCAPSPPNPPARIERALQRRCAPRRPSAGSPAFGELPARLSPRFAGTAGFAAPASQGFASASRSACGSNLPRSARPASATRSAGHSRGASRGDWGAAAPTGRRTDPASASRTSKAATPPERTRRTGPEAQNEPRSTLEPAR